MLCVIGIIKSQIQPQRHQNKCLQSRLFLPEQIYDDLTYYAHAFKLQHLKIVGLQIVELDS